MQFKTWLEQSISDVLAKSDSKPIKNRIKPFLSQHLNGRDLDVAVNLFAYIYLSENTDGDIKKDWDIFKDFLKVNLSSKRNLFLSPITRQQLEDLNLKYHRDLSVNKNLRKGPVGLPVINVEEKLKEISEKIDLPRNFDPHLWSGWVWTSLGCSYSKEEGAAGGHCGNVASSPGDNILSLRDPSQNVLLTFIVNTRTGTLKEAKGINNKKPTPQFHPPIVALVSSDYVKNYNLSSFVYEEEGISDFKPEDLSYNPEIYEFVKSHLEKDDHKTPDNYLPLDWVSQWTDEKINALSNDKKIDLLKEILKVINNHKPLVHNEEDEQKYGPRQDLKINFKFGSLIRSAFTNVQKPKQAIEMLELIGDLYENNKLEFEDDFKQFRPDIKYDKDNFYDWRKKEGVKYRKKDEIDIDDDLLKFVVSHMQTLKMNYRDLSDFTMEMYRLGDREEIEQVGKEVYAHKSRINIFQDEINKNTRFLIEEKLKGNKLSDHVLYTIIAHINQPENRHADPSVWLANNSISKKTVKLVLYFNIPQLTKDAFREYYKSNRHEFEKAGHSTALDRMRYSYVHGRAEPYFPNDLFDCVSKTFRDLFAEEMLKRSKHLGSEIIIGKDSYSNKFDVVVYENTNEYLRNYLKNGTSSNTPKIQKVIDQVQNNTNSIYKKNLKNIDEIIKTNMQKIMLCFKAKQQEFRKPNLNQYERHKKRRFGEWLQVRNRY